MLNVFFGLAQVNFRQVKASFYDNHQTKQSLQPLKSEAWGQTVSQNQFVVEVTKTTKEVTLLEYFCYPRHSPLSHDYVMRTLRWQDSIIITIIIWCHSSHHHHHTWNKKCKLPPNSLLHSSMWTLYISCCRLMLDINNPLPPTLKW